VFLWQIYGFVAAFGGQIVSKDLKQRAWNSPANVRMLQVVADLRQKARLHPRPADIPQGSDLFYTGKGAMQIMGAWQGVAHRQGIGSNFAWDVLRQPLGSEGKRTVSAADAGASLTKQTKQPAAARQWITFYTSTQSLTTMISDPVRTFPGRKSAAERWEQVALGGGLPPKNVASFGAAMADAYPMPNLPYYQEVQMLGDAPLAAILNDGAPIVATLAELDQKANAIIARYTWCARGEPPRCPYAAHAARPC
jgi:multiple sugar transport system substrate-binding protein